MIRQVSRFTARCDMCGGLLSHSLPHGAAAIAEALEHEAVELGKELLCKECYKLRQVAESRRMAKTFDQGSWDLAEKFLCDSPAAGNETVTRKLAQAIQQTIEDFLVDVYDPDLLKMLEATPCA